MQPLPIVSIAAMVLDGAVAGIWRVRGTYLSGIDLPMGQPTQNAVLDAYGS